MNKKCFPGIYSLSFKVWCTEIAIFQKGLANWQNAIFEKKEKDLIFQYFWMKKKYFFTYFFVLQGLMHWNCYYVLEGFGNWWLIDRKLTECNFREKIRRDHLCSFHCISHWLKNQILNTWHFLRSGCNFSFRYQKNISWHLAFSIWFWSMADAMKRIYV